MALKNFNTFPLLDEYLNFLTVIKGRSPNTVVEYRTDILMFFSYLKEKRGMEQQKEKYNLSFVDADFIRSITLNDMYAFISDCKSTSRQQPEQEQEKLYPSGNFGNISNQSKGYRKQCVRRT